MRYGAREQLLKELEADAGRVIDRLRSLATHRVPFSDEVNEESVETPDPEHFDRLNDALRGGAQLADELHQALKVL